MVEALPRGGFAAKRKRMTMINQRKVVAGAALLGLLASQAQADAAQVNIAATAFHTQIFGGDSIMYGGTTSANFSAGTLTMIAALPRVPGGMGATVFVDGFSVVGTYRCTVSGPTSKSFMRVNPPTDWTAVVSFTAAELPSSGYLSISCSVPSDGAFRGVTVIN